MIEKNTRLWVPISKGIAGTTLSIRKVQLCPSKSKLKYLPIIRLIT